MLHEIQQALGDHILAGDGVPATAGIISGKLSRQAQLGIHRANTHASLVGVLQAAYPVICRLVGEDHFNHAALEYVRAHPPRRPQLSTYGWRFARFLSHFKPARGLPFLPDLARLEWARNVAYFAADTAPFEPRHLNPSASEPGQLKLALHPAAMLVASPFAIHQIWTAAAPTRDDTEIFDPNAGADHVLTTRPALHVESRVVSPGDFTLLLALDAGANLEQAAHAAVAIQPNFDLQQALFGHFARGTFRAPSTTSPEEATR